MQYRYGAKSFERKQFDAVKAKLSRSRSSSSCHTGLTGDTEANCGRYTNSIGKISFFAKGRPLETASVPLHTMSASLLHGSSESGPACKPAAATTTVEPPLSGNDANPDRNYFHHGIPDESGLRSANDHISTAALGGVLSVTVAIAAGLIIANTSAFKLAVSSEMHAAAGVIPEIVTTETITTTTAAPLAPEVAIAQPARTIPAPLPSSLSISKLESRPAATARSSSKPASQRKPALSRKKAPDTKLARRTEKAKIARAPRRTESAALVRSVQKPPDPMVHASAAPGVQSRPALPSLGAQYARCGQQQGFLRRERCKWDVCGGKWGKQGCPAYKHRIAPEMGLGHLYPADTASQREGG